MGADVTKERIIQAAKQVFIRKGMDGARMQEIADEAGINKALLHYYFHSKELLFKEVFYGILSNLIPNIITIFKEKGSLSEKIEAVVSTYDTFMYQNPYLPQFVIREINRDPDQLAGFMSDQGLDFQLIESAIEHEIKEGRLRPISFPHLFANLIGMIIIPYVARPLFQRKLFRNDAEKYDNYLRERRLVIEQFVKQAILLP